MALRRGGFIGRSIRDAVSFLKESIFADEYANRNGFLQRIDPRIKTATFLMFIAAVLFSKDIMTILLCYALCLVLARASYIDIGFFLKRTWVFIPIFSLFIAIPAVFSVFTPGDAVFSLDAFRLRLTVTRQGLAAAGLFFTRVLVSVSFSVLLGLTTRHLALLKTLRVFGVPQVFVMTTGMCYRYIYLLFEIIENTFVAIKSRVGTRLHYRKGQRITAWSISTLWRRSYDMSEDIYHAMLSRGFSGEPVLLNAFKTTPRDWIWLFAVTAFCVTLMVYGSRPI